MAEASYGGFWIRTLAYLVDMAIIALALLLLALPLTFLGGAGAALYGLIAAVGPIAYFAWLTASDREATFGKQLCGLKVRHSGEQISLLRSIGRELAKIISAAVMMIGFLLIAFTGRKQGLHDMLASTEVVREGQPRILVAILVVLAGVLTPVIVIPLMFGAMFAGLMAMMLGGAMEQSVKQSRPVPQVERKAAPRPQASAPKPAPQPAAPAQVANPEAPKPVATEAPKPMAAEAPKPLAPEAPKPMAAEPPKPMVAEPSKLEAAPVAAAAPRAPVPRAAPRSSDAATPVMLKSKPPCEYKPVMTDEEIDRCR